MLIVTPDGVHVHTHLDPVFVVGVKLAHVCYVSVTCMSSVLCTALPVP